MEDGTKVISLNKGAYAKWGADVLSQLRDGEELLTPLEDVGHAEMRILRYADDTGSVLKGIGASNAFCGEICRPAILSRWGSAVMGQS